MRQYQLYVRNKRQFEIVPSGFSWGALLLGVFWAGIYGLLYRYLAIIAVSIIPFGIAQLLEDPIRFSLVVVGVTAINAGHLLFAFKAFEWRESALIAEGFALEASIAASSPKLALEKWSKSDGASEFLSRAA